MVRRAEHEYLHSILNATMFSLCECVLTQHAGVLEKEMEQTPCAGEGEDCCVSK